MPKKMKFDEWKEGKEYKMWSKLKAVCEELGLNSDSFISKQDLGGCYWEPALEMIYKFGNMLKKTGKIKEIKMEWMRPLMYLGAQSDVDVTFDGEHYKVPKIATGTSADVKFAFQKLLECIYKLNDLDDNNFQKEYKTFVSELTRFFKKLSEYVLKKDEFGITGYRYLVENIKTILYPLRMLRKSAYRLFSIEKNEEKIKHLLTFQEKATYKEYMEGVHKYFEADTYKQDRQCDVDKLEDVMGIFLNEDFYKYSYDPTVHVEEKKEEKDDKGNVRAGGRMERPKSQSPEELEKKKNEERRRELTLINIEKLPQAFPITFVKEAMQKDFEHGFDLMFQFLAKKKGKDFPFPIESHKMFVNLNLIPKGRELPQTNFYLGNLYNYIEELKVMCYEMKLNGLCRVMIPIQENTEFVNKLKKIYDIHIVIDRILGDKLLYDQYLFIYDMLKFVHDSNLKDDLIISKNRKFIEENIPKYIFYMSMVYSSKIFQKYQENSRIDGGHFTIDQYYQPLKHEVDGANNVALNDYETDEKIEKTFTEDFREKKKLFWHEVEKFGRFWLMEGYFPKEDRDKWLVAIEDLSNINRLVQEDIRDMLLMGNEEKFRQFSPSGGEGKVERERNNKVLGTENSLTSENNLSKYGSGGGTRRRGGKGTKRSTSKKGTNVSNSSKKNEKKMTSRKNSLDSNDAILHSLPKNGNGLRPPFVWNFPIERIEQIREEVKREKELIDEVTRTKVHKRDMGKKGNKVGEEKDFKLKEDPKKNEIRKANPFPYYHDGRTERFMDLFNELYENSMKNALSKGNIWEYVYGKILNVLGVEHIFTRKEVVVEKPPEQEPPKEEKKDEKAGEKKEEKKAGEGENKEEEKKDGAEEKKDEAKSPENDNNNGEEKIEEHIEIQP